jgi:hypothetical protein
MLKRPGQFVQRKDTECARAPVETNPCNELSWFLDSGVPVLQAISIGKGTPMLEPWIIDQIRRKEEERRRGDRPQLELPIPESTWPDESDVGTGYGEVPDPPSERGVVIIGM